MSEGVKPVENAAKAAPAATPKVLDNPALRMLGLPRLRAKLPGRNWLIFFGVVGSFTGAVYYDRRQKKIIQQKWCNAVSHLSEQPLPVNALPRRITVFLAAPPGDSLRPVRENFQEYVKPILLAAGVDWEAVEGRKEGDVRAALAERIRKKRRKAAHDTVEGDASVVEELRANMGIQSGDSRAGDLIVGRHTWKEYIRGLHEGWLGPIKPPPVIEPVEAKSAEIPAADVGDSETATKEIQAEPEKPEEKKPAKPSPTPPYITPTEYSQSQAIGLPSEFPVSCTISNPHLLGFLKTPIRMYRFLNRRQVAEEQGRQVVDFLLTTTPQNYEQTNDWEQKDLLEIEEKDYHKSARAPNPEGEETKERPWIEDVIIDDRIGSRMRKPEHILINTETKGHLVAWKGGVDSMEPISWWRWLKAAFDMDIPEPKAKGWEDGLKTDDS